MDRVAGFTSTGSKRPGALFGIEGEAAPLRMTRSSGCVVWDSEGREYLDYIMGLGSVALGYGHPEVTRAVAEAAQLGVVGPLPPVLEEALAADLCRLIPWLERVRFLKTGAEAMAAAVRLARVVTGRDTVLGCGYHGWLDWCQTGEGRGTPPASQALYRELPFNDAAAARELIRSAGDSLAAVVFEPVILEPPDPQWLAVLREETLRSGALLVADEIKTVCRLAIGGGCERYGIRPDLAVIGKAIANGLPLAAVGGRADVMEAVSRTWISSTLATEFVSLAASQATLAAMVRLQVPAHLTRVGTRLLAGLQALAAAHPEIVVRAVGLPEMCSLEYRDETVSGRVATACAARGLLFKRSAYNFVSLAHDEAIVDRTLGILDEAHSAVAAGPALSP
ncbi:MAG: aminotransferase class III-fold pyridoxal phosphate-dependent enzyme [Gemmatimonadales bacterium]|nr:aminotransferase class III-fold pyridoxal phosphate-dependent enzyme [Gemmatimonadales bacterium]